MLTDHLRLPIAYTHADYNCSQSHGMLATENPLTCYTSSTQNDYVLSQCYLGIEICRQVTVVIKTQGRVKMFSVHVN
jgi:hypothetical protein